MEQLEEEEMEEMREEMGEEEVGEEEMEANEAGESHKEFWVCGWEKGLSGQSTRIEEHK